MNNEILLILSLLFIFGGVLLFYWLFGIPGLYCFTVIATIAANIEVLLVVDAFGMEQTLGNLLFSSTFLITDIISEAAGKKAAQQAVNIGIVTSIFFIVLSQTWLLYIPISADHIYPHMVKIFSNTPRLMIVGLVVYGIVQKFDVWLYHKWWDYTKKKFNDAKKYLWLRNNGSTLLSQLMNTVLFTVGAFYKIYDLKTLVSIGASSYLIFIVTSLADTPVIYLSRRIRKN